MIHAAARNGRLRNAAVGGCPGTYDICRPAEKVWLLCRPQGGRACVWNGDTSVYVVPDRQMDGNSCSWTLAATEAATADTSRSAQPQANEELWFVVCCRTNEQLG